MLKYPYYNDNNTLKLVTVVTVDGTTEYKANCIKHGDEYYTKGIDAILVEGKWYPKHMLIYDYEKQVYKRSSRGMILGYVGIDKNGVCQTGYFTPNPYKNCTIVYKGNHHQFIDYTLLQNNEYVEEDISNGVYWHVNTIKIAGISIETLRRKRVVNNNRNQYNIIDDKIAFENSCQLYKNAKFDIDKDIKNASKYLGNTTFGIELETINGNLPQYIQNKYGVIICKDGSIRDEDGNYPPEYVTVPLKGAKGLQTLRNLSKEVTKRSDIDYKCSYHLHIGGFEKSRLFLISLMKLTSKIQNEVFDMFPLYKTDEIRYANKQKNYCKKVPNIVRYYKDGDFNGYVNESYDNIYMFLSGGKMLDRNFNFKTKRNPWGEHKWNIDSRYYWVNFTNLVFGKHDTIEFRLHTPTTNGDKIINWLFMCNAIVEYAKTYTLDCISNKPISFKEVLNVYARKYKTSYAMCLSSNLIKYYEQRSNKFKQDAQNGVYMSQEELDTDATFSFNTLNINL